MKEYSVSERNKLIAEYLGWSVVIKEGRVNAYNPKGKCITSNWMELSDEASIKKMWDELTNESHGRCVYNKSWDYLMPVIDKIEGGKNQNEGRSTSITRDCSACQGSDNVYQCIVYKVKSSDDEKTPLVIGHSDNSKLDASFNAVVLFIMWYNNQ
ncbi:MAG: hypothetical protein IPJ01_10195 [Micavibrio sp.]|nr:hypothetical protein [Micavibrio sp.]